MSKSAEITRKDMKEPDQFQVVAGQAANWLGARQRQVAIVAGVVAVVLLAVLAVSWNTDRRGRQAGTLLAEVYRISAGEISAVPLPGLPGPFFPDDASRQRAVVLAAAQVLAEYASTPAGAMAALAKGDAHVRLAEWDLAAAAYQAYLATARPEEALRFSALEGLALVEEGKGNLDGALKAWDRVAAEAKGLADRADLEKARLLAAAGRADEARRLLTGFDEVHKGSQLTGEAADRLGKLGGK